jgi:hypothetical protein
MVNAVSPTGTANQAQIAINAAQQLQRTKSRSFTGILPSYGDNVEIVRYSPKKINKNLVLFLTKFEIYPIIKNKHTIMSLYIT